MCRSDATPAPLLLSIIWSLKADSNVRSHMYVCLPVPLLGAPGEGTAVAGRLCCWGGSWREAVLSGRPVCGRKAAVEAGRPGSSNPSDADLSRGLLSAEQGAWQTGHATHMSSRSVLRGKQAGTMLNKKPQK